MATKVEELGFEDTSSRPCGHGVGIARFRESMDLCRLSGTRDRLVNEGDGSVVLRNVSKWRGMAGIRVKLTLWSNGSWCVYGCTLVSLSGFNMWFNGSFWVNGNR